MGTQKETSERRSERTITQLKLLSAQAWELTCGHLDFHAEYDAQLDEWLLEEFERADPDNDRAHRGESSHESLEECLLFALDQVNGPQ